MINFNAKLQRALGDLDSGSCPDSGPILAESRFHLVPASMPSWALADMVSDAGGNIEDVTQALGAIRAEIKDELHDAFKTWLMYLRVIDRTLDEFRRQHSLGDRERAVRNDVLNANMMLAGAGDGFRQFFDLKSIGWRVSTPKERLREFAMNPYIVLNSDRHDLQSAIKGMDHYGSLLLGEHDPYNLRVFRDTMRSVAGTFQQAIAAYDGLIKDVLPRINDVPEWSLRAQD